MRDEHEVLKSRLDEMVLRYCTRDFIASDPVRFAHLYADRPDTGEVVALIAALFSYGRRDLIFRAVEEILDRVDGEPLEFARDFHLQRAQRKFKGFVYRFNREQELIYLFQRLQQIEGEYGGLGSFYQAPFVREERCPAVRDGLESFVSRLIEPADDTLKNRYGMKFLFSSPARGGSCKRLNMFLRWMSRKDEVDLGWWQHIVPPSSLMIPLDTHVGRVARKLGLLSRSANDWQSAQMLTDIFRDWAPGDPVRYDFALFGMGVSEREGFSAEPVLDDEPFDCSEALV